MFSGRTLSFAFWGLDGFFKPYYFYHLLHKSGETRTDQ